MELVLPQPIARGETHRIELASGVQETTCTIDYQRGGDLFLHISLRPGEELAVINDRMGGTWGEEVRTPVSRQRLSELSQIGIRFGRRIQVEFSGITAEFARGSGIARADRIVCSHEFGLERVAANEPELAAASLPIEPGDRHVLLLPCEHPAHPCYVDYTSKGRIVLHVSFRPREGAVVINDQADGHWREEVRLTVLGSMEHIEVSFEAGIARISVGRETAVFSRGTDFSEIDEVSGEGGIQVRARSAPGPQDEGGSDSRATIKVVCRQPEFLSRVLAPPGDAGLIERNRSARPLPDRWNPVLISVVKNELVRLHDFFRHYRGGGVERFVFIDNGSTDGSLEYLMAQPDTDVYQAPDGFDWMLKQRWINKTISGYGHDRWYLYVDADEHAVFDNFGNRTFRDLTILSERRGIKRVRGFLLDMYPDGPLLDSAYSPQGRLADACPFFDSAGYQEESSKELISFTGGPRRRLFGAADPKFNPELTKYPLFCAVQGEHMANPHYLWPFEGNFSSERLIALLHYKFLPGSIEKVRIAVDEGKYWSGSFEYRCYLQILERNPNASLRSEASRRYNGPADLIQCGLLQSCNWGGIQGSGTGARLLKRHPFDTPGHAPEPGA